MNRKSIKIFSVELLLILIAILLIKTINILDYTPGCIFYLRTGLQCPACGGTRCVVSLLNGDIKSAFLFHPVFCVAIIYLLICNIVYLINLNKKKKILTFIYPKPYYAIIFAIIVVIFGFTRMFISI